MNSRETIINFDGINMKLNITKLLLALSALLLSHLAIAATYTYDNVNRLTEVIFDSGVKQAYSYDASGNMSGMTTTGAKADQTVTFGAAPVVALGGSGTLAATASSGLPVTFSPSPNNAIDVCYVMGNTVYSGTLGIVYTPPVPGICTVIATQNGNANFNAAPPVSQAIDMTSAAPVKPLPQHIGLISFVPAQLIVGGSTSVSAISNSGLAVTFSSLTPAICTVAGNTVSGIAAGTCTIAANQAGDKQFAPASQVTQSIVVSLGKSIRSDFNADGKADILWRNLTTGANTLWIMNGGVFGSAVATNPTNLAWTPVALSDFNGDGNADVFWRNKTTGQDILWLMNKGAFGSATQTNTVNVAWDVVGVADFDGDGRADDILWYNTTTRQTIIWLMQNTSYVSSALIGTIASGWVNAGIGDFNGDGKADILWRNPTSGANTLWTINGTTLLGAAAINTVNPIYQVEAMGDFNGDGKVDILWRNPLTSTNIVWLMNGPAYSSSGAITGLANGWKVRKSVDFNGDGKDDLMWRNGANNQIWLMNGVGAPTVFNSATNAVWSPVRE